MVLSILGDVSRGAKAATQTHPAPKNDLQKTFPKDDDYGIPETVIFRKGKLRFERNF